MDSDDEALLREDFDESKTSRPSDIVAASGSAHKTWLRKTEYMSGLVVSDEQRNSAKAKIKGVARSERLEPTTAEEEVDDLERSIEKTFDFAQTLDEEFKNYREKKDASALKHLKHPTKPNLKPTAMYTILPDEKLWSNIYTQISFDNDPVLLDSNTQEQQKTRQREGNKLYRGAIIKQSGDEQKLSGSSVSYLLPRNREANFVDNVGTKSDQSSNELYEYQWIREYIVSVDSVSNPMVRQSRAQDDRYFFMTLDEDNHEANYNQLRLKINLKKKKAKVRNDDQDNIEDGQNDKHPRYVLSRRDFVDKEIKLQNSLKDELVPEDALNEEDEDIWSAVAKKH